MNGHRDTEKKEAEPPRAPGCCPTPLTASDAAPGGCKYRRLLNTIRDGVVMADGEGKIVECNRAFLDMLGYTAGELVGLPVRQLSLPFRSAGEEGDAAEGRLGEFEGDFRRKDGSTVPVALTVWPALDEQGTPVGLWSVVRDISERKRLEEAVRHQAYHDALTGLPNRMLFMDRLSLELSLAKRERRRVAVLVVDLDRFKGINDSLGHPIGDRLLQEIAERLSACVRQSDTVARIGGDEFALLLPALTHAEGAAVIAEKAVTSIEKPLLVGRHELRVSASIGISMYPDDGQTAETLLKHADIAMYHVKGQGRNNFQFYNAAMNLRTLERLLLESSLRRTIERGERGGRGELLLYYQPRIDLDTHRIVCAEALVRWKHPELGILGPLQFIPVAEETGLISRLDEWVLRAVCSQIKAWRQAGHPPPRVAVNISAYQFLQPRFTDMLGGVLCDAGIEPQSLEIEITENAAMRDIERATPLLSRLTEQGITFALDDFGAGYSSLGHLKRLPIQRLKIDKSFIRGIIVGRDDREIVNAVVALAHSLKMKVVAEGVETKEQAVFLQRAGCDEAQGFLLGEPLPAEGFERHIAAPADRFFTSA